MTSPSRRISFCRGMLLGLFCVFAFGQAVAQEAPPVDLDQIYTRALNSADDDSVKEAIRVLEQAAERASEPARVHIGIGRLYTRLRDSDRAIRAFRRAVQADSALAGAHAELGLAFLDLKKDWRGALPHLRAAVARDSMNAELQYHLARAYARGGMVEARKAADRAIRLDPDYAPPYVLLAQVYEADGMDDIALLYYRKYLEREPEDQEAVYLFARRLAETGRTSEAERLLGRLDDLRGYAILAQIYMARGNYDDAVLAFEEFISGLPETEQEFYRDISTVGTPREAAAYKATPPENREEFLRQFWLDRDPLLASGGLMRRAEHYRRVLYARENYSRKQFPWDRRGEVYIRYGEPDYRSTSKLINTRVPQGAQIIQTELARRLYGPDAVSYTFLGPVYPIRTERFTGVIPEDNPDLDDLPRMPNEGSMLGRAGVAPEDTLGFYGYKPVTTGLAGMTVPWEVWIYTKLGGGIEVVFTDELIQGRYDYAPVPTMTGDDRARLELAGPWKVLEAQRLFSSYAPETVMRKTIRETPEIYDIGVMDALNFHFDVLDSRGAEGQTDVRVFTGVPVRNLVVAGAGDTAFVQRRVALIEQRSKQVHRIQGDIVVSLSGAGGSAIVEEFPMTVPPGDYMLALQVWRTGTRRMGVYHLPTEVESYAGEALMISDIQVAREVSPADSGQSGQFIRSGFRVVPSPGRAFYKGQHVFLYFEIYNLTRDTFGQTRYEVAYTVRDANQSALILRALSGLGRLLSGGAREGAVTIRYEQTGSREWEGDYVGLDVGDAQPGEHEVRVTVKDLNGEHEVSKTARFHIVKAGGP